MHGGSCRVNKFRKQVVLSMTPCVVIPRRAVVVRPNTAVLVIVVVIMLVAAANGWSLEGVTALVIAASAASGLRARRSREGA